MSRNEDQATITTWQRETFGETTPWHAFQRMQKEYWELRDLIHAMDHGRKVALGEVAGELADVLITLYRVAEVSGINLEAAVDHKMQINRARKWAVDATGNGQHIKEVP